MHRSIATAPAAALSAILLAGCGSPPWAKYPMSTPPDQSCQTGVEGGDVIFVWSCVNGRHVVIHQFTTVLSASDPVREEVACGEKTPYEKENMPPGFVCATGMKWQTTP